MGRAKGKNGSFIAITMRIHQNLSSSMNPRGHKKTEAGGYAQISDCYVYMCIYMLLFLYRGALVGCPDVSKN